MFISKELEKKKEIIRSGEIPTIKLPNNRCSAYDVLININSKELSFIDGDSIFIIDKTIGISEESELTVFFADKYIIVELQLGKIYLKDDKGATYYVTETGSVGEKYIDEKSIKWLTKEDLMLYIGIMVKNKYNLPDDGIAKKYIDNLSITVVTANELIKDEEKPDDVELYKYMFRLKVKDYYDDLGLDKFDYKVYEPKHTDSSVHIPPTDEPEPFWDDEKRQVKSEKRKEIKAELEYKRIKDGDDFVDSDYEVVLEDDDYLEDEELYELNGFSITDEVE